MIAKVLIAIALWTVLLPALYILGSLVGPFVKKERNVVLRGIIFIAFGFGLFGYFIALIGTLGAFRFSVCAAFILIVLVVRMKKLKEFSVWFKCLLSTLIVSTGTFGRVFQLLFLAAVGLTFALCFLPETGNDALCYQLNIPKIFVWHGSTQPIYYDLNSYVPLLMNCLYAAGLLLNNVATAKLFHWFMGFFLAVSVMEIAREETGQKSLASILGTMLFLTPTLFNQITTTYVDVAASLFVFLGIVLLQKGISQKSISIMGLSGCLFGLAVSIKLLMLIAVIAGLAVFLFEFAISACMKIAKGFAAFVAGGALTCGFWFIRNAILTGNPIYPYFGWFFGSENFDFIAHYTGIGLPKTLVNFLLLPWNLTVQPAIYDFNHWWGPFYMLALPFFVLAGIFIKKARLYFVFSFTYFVGWYLLAQNARFLLPVFSVYLLIAGFAMTPVRNLKIIGRILQPMRLFLATVAVTLFVLGVYHYRIHYFALFGIWDEKTYLTNLERSYPIADWINTNLPKDAKILNAEEVRQFYFGREMVRERWFELREHYTNKKSGSDVLDFLRKRGFTHVLRADFLSRTGQEIPVERWVLLDQELERNGQVKKLVTMESKNIREPRFEYTLYQL